MSGHVMRLSPYAVDGALYARIAELEAKLAKAVGALKDIAETGDEYSDGWDAKVCGNIALAALALIEKETK